MKKLLAALAMTLSLNTFAFSVAPPTQYSGLQWRVTGSTGYEPNAYCTSMTLNGIADFSSNYMISFTGTLNCNNGAYTVIGSGYLNTDGGISMGLYTAPGYYWNCQTNSSLNASCKVIAPATGATLGYPVISFQ